VAPARAEGPVVVEIEAPPDAEMPPPAANHEADAISALTNLGYSVTEAATAVAGAARDAPDADTATLIRAGLRALAPKG